MNHRDRVRAALNHQPTDRCPMQISFTPEFARRLRADMKLDDADAHNPHGGGNTYQLEQALDQDMLLTSVGWANSYYGGDEYTDEWGVGWQASEYETPFGTGHYTEMVHHPLTADGAIETYQPPDPDRDELYQPARQLLDDYGGEYWIVGLTVTTIFETAWALRGYDRLMMDFYDDPDLAGRILEMPYHYHLTAARRLVEMGVDMIWLGDDVGGQSAMIISPDCWRRFLKPRMAHFIAELKRINPEIKVAYHSDGCIQPIIDELIEIGVDVLNPIQPACMDPAEIKRQYGDRLCFWGTIDEQHTLPFAPPADVAAEVRLRIETVGASGGLIIGPTHHVQLDTPIENFHAMVETIRNTPCG